jgi:hypothetical protein
MNRDKIVLTAGITLTLLVFALTLYFRSGAFR